MIWIMLGTCDLVCSCTFVLGHLLVVHECIVLMGAWSWSCCLSICSSALCLFCGTCWCCFCRVGVAGQMVDDHMNDNHLLEPSLFLSLERVDTISRERSTYDTWCWLKLCIHMNITGHTVSSGHNRWRAIFFDCWLPTVGGRMPMLPTWKGIHRNARKASPAFPDFWRFPSIRWSNSEIGSLWKGRCCRPRQST
jgi:hypothetical protein